MYSDTSSTNAGEGKDSRVRTFCLITNIPSGLPEQDLYRCLRTETNDMMRVLMLPKDYMKQIEVKYLKEQQESATNTTENTSSSTTTATATTATKVSLLKPTEQDIKSLDTYALALYASKEAALEASEATIELEFADSTTSTQGNVSSLTTKKVTLKLIPIQTEKVVAPELFHSESITVEGEVILKSELADTFGLAAVFKSSEGYRGSQSLVRLGPASVAQWCNTTQQGKDCPFGIQCRHLHRKKFQVTITPRVIAGMTIRGRDGNIVVSNQNQNNTNDQQGQEEQDKNFTSTTSCRKFMNLIPQEWRIEGGNESFRSVELSKNDVEFFIENKNNSNNQNKVPDSLDISIQQAMNSLIESHNKNTNNNDNATGIFPQFCDSKKNLVEEAQQHFNFFIKFDIPHGSPSDCLNWHQPNYFGMSKRIPLRLKRDIMMHSSWRQTHNDNNSSSAFCCRNSKEAILLLKKSRKACSALRNVVSSSSSSTEENTNDSASAAAAASAASVSSSSLLNIRIEPFDPSLWVPSSQFQILWNGKRFAGSSQRESWLMVDVVKRDAAGQNDDEDEDEDEDIIEEEKASATTNNTSINKNIKEPLITENLQIVDAWRQYSKDRLSTVLNDLIPHLLSNNNNNFGSSSPLLLSINVACPATLIKNKNSGEEEFSFRAPRILSVHDAENDIVKSTLLSRVGKTATEKPPKVVWRVRPSAADELPSQMQNILESQSRN